MPLHYESYLKPYARDLRKSMTLAERKLWWRLRRKQLCGVQFYRQKALGRFIVDFYCPARRLVIELDGGQHYLPEGRASDDGRSAFLEGLGLQVLRFSDRDVMTRTDDVVQAVLKALLESGAGEGEGSA